MVAQDPQLRVLSSTEPTLMLKFDFKKKKIGVITLLPGTIFPSKSFV